MLPFLETLPEEKMDAIQRANKEYEADPRAEKVPLHIGVMKNAAGKDVFLDSVIEAEKRAAEKRKSRNGYIAKEELLPYYDGVKKLLFGDNPKLHERVAITDAYGGTNALYLLQLFLNKFLEQKRYLLSCDSWPNYKNQIQYAFGEKLTQYRICDENINYLHIEFQKAVEESDIPFISIEQNSPHNGLGISLPKEAWDEKLQLIKKYNGIVLFDSPYAGLGPSLEHDLYPIKKAIEMGIFTLIAHSESKISSAYDQRIGASLIIAPDANSQSRIQSALNKLERAVQSYTAKTHLTFAELYGSPELYSQYQQEFAEKIVKRCRHVRELAIKHLGAHPHIANILQKGGGLFASLPMERQKANNLWEKEAIMLVRPDNPSVTFGDVEVVRLNLTGLQTDEKAAQTLAKIATAL